MKATLTTVLFMSVYKECYIMTQKMKADGDSKQDN